MAEKQNLVVIGNGTAGARFVEEMVALGGQDTYDITVIGEETWGNYNRILLSGVLSGTHDPDDIFINPIGWYEENDVELHAGVRVIGIDRKGKTAYGFGGLLLPYDKLVIATGSSAFAPPMDGLYGDGGSYKPGVFVFRTLDDCSEMIEYAGRARKAAVIGGGLLGLEAARGLMNRGLEVDVVHPMGWLMDTQLDSRSGQLLKQSLEELGVRFHLEKLTTTVLGDGSVTGLPFKDGGAVDCDMVVISAGIRPNVIWHAWPDCTSGAGSWSTTAWPAATTRTSMPSASAPSIAARFTAWSPPCGSRPAFWPSGWPVATPRQATTAPANPPS